jgi:hypothetical protein
MLLLGMDGKERNMTVYVLTVYDQPDYYGFYIPRGVTDDLATAEAWKARSTSEYDQYDYEEYTLNEWVPNKTLCVNERE